MLTTAQKHEVARLYDLGYADVYQLALTFKCSTTEIVDALKFYSRGY